MKKIFGKTKRQWYMAGNKLYAKLARKRLFWTFEDMWGEVYDMDYDHMIDAEKAAQEWFMRYCDDMEYMNYNSEWLTILEYFYDDRTGKRFVTQVIETCVEWEDEISDIEEHGTWNKHGTGCW